MLNGARPTVLDPRDHSYARTFGTVLVGLPDEYNVDAGLTIPDQVADGNPFSCTGYTTTDLATDQDGILYSPEYTYMKTLYIQGLPPETNGSDIRFSLKSSRVYGLLPRLSMPINLMGKGEDYTADQANWPIEVDAEAGKLQHRKAGYFNIYSDSGLDWFDSMRSAMWLNKADKRGISVGTPWFSEWTSTQEGKLTEHFVYDGNPFHYAWHNWAIKGWKVIDGVPYLIGKPWLGKNYGDKGFCYLDRATINKVMEIRGSIAYTIKDANPDDIRTIQLSIIELILLFMTRIIGKIRYA